jgi:hypothetical protein
MRLCAQPSTSIPLEAQGLRLLAPAGNQMNAVAPITSAAASPSRTAALRPAEREQSTRTSQLIFSIADMGVHAKWVHPLPPAWLRMTIILLVSCSETLGCVPTRPLRPRHYSRLDHVQSDVPLRDIDKIRGESVRHSGSSPTQQPC